MIGLFTPLRAGAREEEIGMDVVQHGEESYASADGAILVVPADGEDRTAIPA